MIEVKIGITGKGKKAIETELKLETGIPAPATAPAKKKARIIIS